MSTVHNTLPVIGVTLLAGLLFISACQAEDGWNVEGEHGELHVHGVLLEGACRLDMRSVYQEVSMNGTTLGMLRKTGYGGEPVTFVLRLLDCQRTGGHEDDFKQGNATWDAIQPVITISFSGVSDPNNPSLLLMKGIEGAGLMIRDSNGDQIIPGERGIPQFVTPGSNQLIYQVIPVRTSAPLIAGTFRSVVDFKVNYD
jgi:type 1 fimbria pilin